MTRATANARIEVRPVLQGVRSGGDEAPLDKYFRSEVLPLLTPIAIDRGHPLPRLRHGSWGLVVRFRRATYPRYGVILVHAALPATVEDPTGGRIGLAQLIALHVAALFDESPIESCWAFYVGPDAFAAEGHEHEVARFLADALERSERKLQEALPCAA